MIFKNSMIKKVFYVVAAVCVSFIILGAVVNAAQGKKIFAQSTESVLSQGIDNEQAIGDTTALSFEVPEEAASENLTSQQPKNSNAVILETISSFKPHISLGGVARALLGLVVVLFIAWLCSTNRKAIKWKFVLSALLFQVIIAVCILYIPFVSKLFEWLGKIFVYINLSAAAGTSFLFGNLFNNDSIGYVFAFSILPTIIFFSAISSLLFHWGIIQFVVKWLGKFFSKIMGLTGVESLSLAGNIFMGQTEAPLIVKSYLPRVKDSELFMVMVGGMATMAGGVLAAYIAMLGGGDPVLQVAFAKHLLAASVMAAPASVVIGKIVVPSDEGKVEDVVLEKRKKDANVLDVIANGAIEGMKLAVNVAAMLLVFIALIALVNFIFAKIGAWTDLNEMIAANTPYKCLSLEFIVGYAFSPIMWLIGVPGPDVLELGQLLGIKTIVNEFVGYDALKNMLAAGSLQPKSIIMAVYILCGFANFSSIGIQIGGIGSLAPNKRPLLAKFGIRALLTAASTALLSAIMVGMLLG
ncbi:MAG: nucleoside transporter C-terminal domain-containing protein [Bacteroidales bacterium]|nr:nucleoside transporter C-terminal domain-containing protein [Bacteroidales bacterium]